MSTTPTLTPGQIVQHAAYGYGLVDADGDAFTVTGESDSLDNRYFEDLTGWEPIEVLPTGHVAVRVDDLDQWNITHCHTAYGRLVEAWRAQRRPAQPAQPDEPQEFGARVTVTKPSGHVEKWVRVTDGMGGFEWEGDGGWSGYDWDELTQRGQIALGWGDAK